MYLTKIFAGKIMGKIISAVKGFFKQWNKPEGDNYVASKEIIAYSVGGMGVFFIASIANNITLSSACLLIGAVYKISPTVIITLANVNTIVTLLVQPLKSWLIDNTPGKQGKARPWLLWLGGPTALFMSLIAYIPNTWSVDVKAVLVGVIFIFMNFCYQFYYGMYIQLSQLMTPNTNERAKIISLSSIIYSMAPTITGVIFPLIAAQFGENGTGWYSQNFYRVIAPVMTIFGYGLSLIAYFFTKERIVVAKRYEQKVKFADGFSKILKNKYLWIANIGVMLAVVRGSITTVMGWEYVYVLQNDNIYSVMSLIMGTASLFGMALGPIMMKKIGKKNTVILANAIFAGASMITLLFVNNFALFSVGIYLCYFSAAVQIITSPAMNGDALDYQQWKTGDRLEGFAGNFAIITSIVALGTNYIMPFVNEYFGLVTDYNVLYDTSVRLPMFRVLSVISLIGSVLFIIPYLFWDLSDEKHKKIIEDLKERARAQNIEDGYADASILYSDEKLEADENIYEENSEELVQKQAEVLKTLERGGEIVDDTLTDDNQETAKSDNAFEDGKSDKLKEDDKEVK